MPSTANTDHNESSADHDENTPDDASRNSTSNDSNETDTSTEVSLEDIPRASARAKAVGVLETLDELGGESNTTELRKNSGRSSDEIKYQYKILGDEHDRVSDCFTPGCLKTGTVPCLSHRSESS